MFEQIVEKNSDANKARVVAGYCWDWKGKKDQSIRDVVIPEFDFAKRWNLGSDGGLWIVKPDSVNEIGCIHTCQGLELDYVGVVIGGDLVVRDGKVVTDAGKRSSQDSSIRGYKTMLKEDPGRARGLADRVVKNTYRTLLTRGQKGCFVFCVDPETNAWFKERASTHVLPAPVVVADNGRSQTRVVTESEARELENCVPVVDVRYVAGKVRQRQWVKLPQTFRARAGLFAAQLEVDSFDGFIPKGSWCLFQELVGQPQAGTVVLASLPDDEASDSLTLRVYKVEVLHVADAGLEQKIGLLPANHSPDRPIVEVMAEGDGRARMLGEFVALLP
jgi:DUF2075 family protein